MDLAWNMQEVTTLCGVEQWVVSRVVGLNLDDKKDGMILCIQSYENASFGGIQTIFSLYV